jgi:hypothetical protein
MSCSGSAFKFPTHFVRRNSRGNLSLHLNHYISNQLVLFCAISEYSSERGLSYTLKSPNKQLMHTFLHFVVSLQSRLYTLELTFVFDVKIYSSSLRLFESDPVESLLPATHRQYFIFALSFPFRCLRVTFVLNTLIVLKELFLSPET